MNSIEQGLNKRKFTGIKTIRDIRCLIKFIASFLNAKDILCLRLVFKESLNWVNLPKKRNYRKGINPLLFKRVVKIYPEYIEFKFEGCNLFDLTPFKRMLSRVKILSFNLIPNKETAKWFAKQIPLFQNENFKALK